MKQRVDIKVEVPDSVKVGAFKELYSTVVLLDDSLKFDYNTIIQAFKMLYLDKHIFVSFVVSYD